MAKKDGNFLGSWAFLIGVILALVLGVFGFGSNNPTFLTVLVIIGLIIGLLNVGSDEVQSFLLSGTVLIIASAFGQNVLNDVPLVNDIFKAILVIFVPATVIVAIRNVFVIAKR